MHQSLRVQALLPLFFQAVFLHKEYSLTAHPEHDQTQESLVFFFSIRRRNIKRAECHHSQQ